MLTIRVELRMGSSMCWEYVLQVTSLNFSQSLIEVMKHFGKLYEILTKNNQGSKSETKFLEISKLAGTINDPRFLIVSETTNQNSGPLA